MTLLQILRCGRSSRIALFFAFGLHGRGFAAAWPVIPQPLGATEAAAAISGLPGNLIQEVVREESAGDPTAVSRAGAMGLMQLMPGTWADLRARLSLGADPFDPRDNAVAGAVYLRGLLDRFGLPGGLAAYNLGPSRYVRLRRRGAVPSRVWAYVARVLSRPLPDPGRARDPAGAGPASLAPSSAGLFVMEEFR